MSSTEIGTERGHMAGTEREVTYLVLSERSRDWYCTRQVTWLVMKDRGHVAGTERGHVGRQKSSILGTPSSTSPGPCPCSRV
eukprot:3738718-Rhodomonas_salina.1